MPSKCWCGNDTLNVYSAEYNRCDACCTLVSKAEISDKIYSVTSEADDLYGANYWEDNFLKIANVSSLTELNDVYLTGRTVYWLNHLLKYMPPPATVAEIGCGLGQMPYLTKQAGYTQTAVELSPKICQYAAQTFDINILNGTIDELTGTFDAIIFLDVIEHLTDPLSFINKVKNHTNPNTVLMIQCPCYNPSWSHEQARGYSPAFIKYLMPQEHIYLFSRIAMEKILRLCGFKFINFEPAFFGEYCDMFLVASQSELKEISQEERLDTLIQKPDGWLLRAIFKSQLESEKKISDKNKEITNLKRQLENANNDRINAMNYLAEVQQELMEKKETKQTEVKKKKTMVYVGYSFHLKTKSTRFLIDIFKTEYDIYEYAFDVVNPKNNHGYVGQPPDDNIEYDMLILFQIGIKYSILKSLFRFKKAAHFPMYDGSYLVDHKTYWASFKNFNIINFSKTLHETILANGCPSFYIQYFPKPIKTPNQGDNKSAFFWERTPITININNSAQLLEPLGVKNIHIHKALDPLCTHVEPTNEVLNAFKITESEWFETKDDMLKKVAESVYYIAPRLMEGIGMSFLEAMAMGRCVIAPNQPTMNEYIINGETGLLYDFKNPKPLTTHDPKRIQQNTHEYIKNGYENWEKNKFDILEWINHTNSFNH